MKIQLLIPIIGELVERNYYKQGVFPYRSFSEKSIYQFIRFVILILIVGLIVL